MYNMSTYIVACTTLDFLLCMPLCSIYNIELNAYAHACDFAHAGATPKYGGGGQTVIVLLARRAWPPGYIYIAFEEGGVTVGQRLQEQQVVY